MEKNRLSIAADLIAADFVANNLCAANEAATHRNVARMISFDQCGVTSHGLPRTADILRTCVVASFGVLLAFVFAGRADAQGANYSYYQSAPRSVQASQQNYAQQRGYAPQGPQYRMAQASAQSQASPFPRTDRGGNSVARNPNGQSASRGQNMQGNSGGELPPIYSVAKRPGTSSTVAGIPTASYGQDSIAPPVPSEFRETRSLGSPMIPRVARKLPRARKPYISPPIRGGAGVRSLQDEDPFGELATESPFSPAPQDNGRDNPFNEPAQTNQLQNEDPFGEGNNRTDPLQPDVNQIIPGVDPTPNTPPMDTQSIPPRLPGDGAFTPDPGGIPALPIPGGGDTERPNESEYPNGAVLPGGEDENSDRDPRGREPDGRTPTPANPNDRGGSSGVGGGYEKQSTSGQRYLPAPNPTYYSAPIDHRGVPGGYMGPNQMKAIAAMANAAGYTNNALPGPYGYTGMMNPYAAMAQGYQDPALANMNPSGSCSTGCVPVNTCQAYTAAMLQLAPQAALPQQAPVYAPSIQLPTPPATTYVGQQASTCGVPTGAPQFASAGCPQPVASGCPPAYSSDPCCPDPCSGSAYQSVIDDGCATCYLSLFGGSSSLTNLIAREDRDIGTYFDNAGYGIGGSLGQIQGRNLRLELEVSYRSQDVNGLRLLDGDGTAESLNLTGDFSTLAGMANAFWEFVDFPSGQFKPYVGAGVGFVTAFPDFNIDGTAVMTNDHESSLAYQWIAGVNYKLERQTDLFVEYRYFRADSLSLNTDITPASTNGNGSGKIDHVADNIFFGLRMRF